jgi:hypothetical protein
LTRVFLGGRYVSGFAENLFWLPWRFFFPPNFLFHASEILSHRAIFTPPAAEPVIGSFIGIGAEVEI